MIFDDTRFCHPTDVMFLRNRQFVWDQERKILCHFENQILHQWYSVFIELSFPTQEDSVVGLIKEGRESNEEPKAICFFIYEWELWFFCDLLTQIIGMGFSRWMLFGDINIHKISFRFISISNKINEVHGDCIVHSKTMKT